VAEPTGTGPRDKETANGAMLPAADLAYRVEDSVAATTCHDCGAELGKPSDRMRHKCPIALARAARLGREVVSPSRLHALCRGDHELYIHAMCEAGYIVEKATGKPENPCRSCGWSPDA
jgi:hypothetical protein